MPASFTTVETKMSDPLAMALDDVIKQKKGGKGGRGGGKGAGGRGGGRGGKGGRGGRGGGRGGRNDRGGERRKAGGVQRQRRNRTNRSSPYSKVKFNFEFILVFFDPPLTGYLILLLKFFDDA